jgi:3-hydroxyisobutyrate dehydrogenase
VHHRRRHAAIRGDHVPQRSARVEATAATVEVERAMAGIEIAPGKTRIGWIGTGVMGSSMCGHLIKQGFQATVYNRADKAQALLAEGAAWADTPKQLAERSDVVFSIVGFPRDVREVLLGADGALAGAKAGAILVDMTTSEPSLAVEVHAAAAARGVHSVDAPVSGGDIGAREPRLSIMIGGDTGRGRRIAALFRSDGQDDRPPGRTGRGPAHQDGESNADRRRHDQRLRGARYTRRRRG